MKILISYDISQDGISGRRRLRKVSKLCLNFGQRVQYSVFECSLTPSQWLDLKAKLLEEVDIEQDSLRFYLLGHPAPGDIEHHGVRSVLNIEGTLII